VNFRSHSQQDTKSVVNQCRCVESHIIRLLITLRVWFVRAIESRSASKQRILLKRKSWYVVKWCASLHPERPLTLNCSMLKNRSFSLLHVVVATLSVQPFSMSQLVSFGSHKRKAKPDGPGSLRTSNRSLPGNCCFHRPWSR